MNQLPCTICSLLRLPDKFKTAKGYLKLQLNLRYYLS